jgi:hypothetical protein
MREKVHMDAAVSVAPSILPYSVIIFTFRCIEECKRKALRLRVGKSKRKEHCSSTTRRVSRETTSRCAAAAKVWVRHRAHRLDCCNVNDLLRLGATVARVRVVKARGSGGLLESARMQCARLGLYVYHI